MLDSPFCVSLCGVDDAVDLADLVTLDQRFSFVEWGVSHLPENEGHARNPTRAWRQALAQARKIHGLRTALHLCGHETFHEILTHTEPDDLLAELHDYDRIQVNINARALSRFTSSDIFKIYDRLFRLGHSLILQINEDNLDTIERFLSTLEPTVFRSEGADPGIDILYDASHGKGLPPESWQAPYQFRQTALRTGYAGGLSPETIGRAMTLIDDAVATSITPHPFWLDMASGIRTDNRFDFDKVKTVLTLVAARYPVLSRGSNTLRRQHR